jgi:hypothetical protein
MGELLSEVKCTKTKSPNYNIANQLDYFKILVEIFSVQGEN